MNDYPAPINGEVTSHKLEEIYNEWNSLYLEYDAWHSVISFSQAFGKVYNMVFKYDSYRT